MNRESSSRLIGYFPENPLKDRSLLKIGIIPCRQGKPEGYTLRVHSIEDTVFVEDPLIRSNKDAAVQARKLKKLLERRGYIISKIQ